MLTLSRQPASDDRHRTLVVLLHAYTHTSERLDSVEDAVHESIPAAHVVKPQLPLQMWSTANLDDVAAAVVDLIDGQLEQRAAARLPRFEKIILVGHSTGSMIARKAYVLACGETLEAPFRHRDSSGGEKLQEKRAWAEQVDRIVQLSGMNGGWSVSHHMGMRRTLEFSLGNVAANLVLMVTGRVLAIHQIRRGATFLSGLRLQWLAMMRQRREMGVKSATVVQLLGTVDDLVSPEDNVDLVSGGDFLYLDVPSTGHVNVIEMAFAKSARAPSQAEIARRTKFQLALVGDPESIRSQSTEPFDYGAVVRETRENFTHVIFVMHGIRDAGFWTHKIARRVKAAGRDCIPEQVYATVTSTYGYFPMLSFLLPWRRREKVAWLMDQYAKAKSLYPTARFSYLGHSNGTYLLARALQENPACRFDRVVFAGSVVRKDYDWALATKRGQVSAMLNYVATDDKVVACFPGALEQLEWQDLGSAGHSGFGQMLPGAGNLPFFEVRFVKGGHSAALSEDQWDGIAQFICNGKPPVRTNVADEQTASVRLLGRFPLIAWALILLLLVAVTAGLWQVPSQWLRTVLLMAFAWSVAKILTRF